MAEHQWLELARNRWNERAAEWDVMSRENALASDRGPEIDRMIAAMDLHEGDRVLDAGCGTGQFGIAFGARGLRVDGFDLSPEMIARANANAITANQPITFSLGSLDKIDASDSLYDAILARAVLQLAPDLVVALNEFRRVLRPDGAMCLSVPGALSPAYDKSWLRFIEGDMVTLNYLVPWELEALLAPAGWQVADEWGSYDAISSGGDNLLHADQAATLPRRLRQAAATSWYFVFRQT